MESWSFRAGKNCLGFGKVKKYAKLCDVNLTLITQKSHVCPKKAKKKPDFITDSGKTFLLTFPECCKQRLI